MMDAWKDVGEGGEPTLVMGASIVMEWIRAIEECLRCELPEWKNKKNKKRNSTQMKVPFFSLFLMRVCV